MKYSDLPHAAVPGNIGELDLIEIRRVKASIRAVVNSLSRKVDFSFQPNRKVGFVHCTMTKPIQLHFSTSLQWLFYLSPI